MDINMEELLIHLRESVQEMENVTEKDVFICSFRNPWSEKVTETHMVTIHPNTRAGACEDCGLRMDEID